MLHETRPRFSLRPLFSTPRRAFVLGLLAMPAHADDQATRAVAFIQEAGVELGRIARSAATTEARRAALKPFLTRVVDMTDLSRFCLGRFWSRADAAHRQRFQALFEDVILVNVLHRLGTYKRGDSRVVVGPANPTDDGYEVPTTVQSGRDPAVRVSWRVSFATGAPKIVDVSAEGISLRVTLRGDFSSYLNRNGDDFEALFAAMRRLIARS